MTDIARLNQLRALAVEAKEFEENIHKDEVFDKYDEYDTYPNELFQAAFRPAKAIELIDEIDSLRTQLAAAQAEAEALRKDAERYRWLRTNTDDQIPFRGWWQIAGGAGADQSRLDAAIDAAMGGQKEASK